MPTAEDNNPISQLPHELQLMIANEVAAFHARPADINKPIMHDDWLKVLASLGKLSQVDSISRDLASGADDTLSTWTLYPRAFLHTETLLSEEGRHGHRYYSELMASHPYCDHRMEWLIPKWKIGQLPAGQIQNLALGLNDIREAYYLLQWAVQGSELEMGHNRSVKLAAAKHYIARFDRANWVPPSRSRWSFRDSRRWSDRIQWLLVDFPLDSTKYFTIVLDGLENAGLGLDPQHYYFRRVSDGKWSPALFLPSPKQIDRTAELLVSLFPFLIRLTIVRKPLTNSLMRSWRSDQHEFERRTFFGISDVRNLFLEKGQAAEPIEPPLSEPPLLLPVRVGRHFIESIEGKKVAQALRDSDEALLRCVHEKIAKRTAGAPDAPSTEQQ